MCDYKVGLGMYDRKIPLVASKRHHSTPDIAKPHTRKLSRSMPYFDKCHFKGIFFTFILVQRKKANDLQFSANFQSREPVLDLAVISDLIPAI